MEPEAYKMMAVQMDTEVQSTDTDIINAQHKQKKTVSGALWQSITDHKRARLNTISNNSYNNLKPCA